MGPAQGPQTTSLLILSLFSPSPRRVGVPPPHPSSGGALPQRAWPALGCVSGVQRARRSPSKQRRRPGVPHPWHCPVPRRSSSGGRPTSPTHGGAARPHAPSSSPVRPRPRSGGGGGSSFPNRRRSGPCSSPRRRWCGGKATLARRWRGARAAPGRGASVGPPWARACRPWQVLHVHVLYGLEEEDKVEKKRKRKK